MGVFDRKVSNEAFGGRSKSVSSGLVRRSFKLTFQLDDRKSIKSTNSNSFQTRSSRLFNLTFEGPSNRQIRTRSKVVQVDLSNWHSKLNRVESSMFFCSSFQFLLQMDRVAENSITRSKPFDRAPQNFDLCLYVIETRLSHIFSPTPSARKNFLSKHNLKKFLEIALPSLISQKFGGRWRVALITL